MVRSKNSKIRTDFETCKRHGKLDEENSYIETSNGIKRLRCKECREIGAVLLRANNPEKFKVYDFGICHKHGILDKETSYSWREKGKKRTRCVLCRREREQNLSLIENKICKVHGEISSENIGSKGRCKICLREIARNRDKDHRNELERKNYYKNIEQEQVRGQIKNKNITREQYYKMVDVQNNKCAICNNQEKRISKNGIDVRRLSIDHDHKTGKVRELLCTDCNTTLGKMNDSITLLQKAIEYLRKHNTHDEHASTE